MLALQDSSSLNYSTHPTTENLGPIGSRPEGIIGLMLHATLAINPAGTPSLKPPTLREATRMVGVLGGFLARKSDGEPGTK